MVYIHIEGTNAKQDIKAARYHLLNINPKEPIIQCGERQQAVSLCWSIPC